MHGVVQIGIAITAMLALWTASQLVPASRAVSVTVAVTPVPLNPHDLSQHTVGEFAYAGGIALRSRPTDHLHGLSDLEVTDSNRVVAVGDDGIFFDAQLAFDSSQRLAGVTDATITVLNGGDGKPLLEKADTDAEGLAILPSGDRLVSFERHDRILFYPATGLRPRRVPAPETSFPSNGGMEALAADHDAGADAYVVGGEISGDTWACRVSARCVAAAHIDKPREFGLVSMKRLHGLDAVYLLRAFDRQRGSRLSLQVFRSGQMVGRMDLARPLTVDNYEGVAAVRRSDGAVRFYLLSDDNGGVPDANGGDPQRTLLVAFDWTPR
jgi:hypothetical protein